MGKPIRVVTSGELRPYLEFAAVIGSVEAAYRAVAEGRLTSARRAHLIAPGTHTFLSVTPAVSADLGITVFAYTGGNRGARVPQKLAIVFSPEDGGVRCLIESDLLSWMRTGATSGVATRYLAREDAQVLGIFGAGKQARAQLLAVSAVRPINEALVYSPNPTSREAFATEMTEQAGFVVEAVSDPRAILAEAHIVCTATTSAVPVFDGALVRPGTHINAIGQHYPDRRELDTKTMLSSRLFADDVDTAFIDYGEIVIPIAEGLMDSDALLTGLDGVVAGTVAGRSNEREITVMLSGGVAAEYLAAANVACAIAEQRGLGREIDLMA